MTFKITIERAPIGVEFEVGSIAEAISILEQEDTNLRRVVSIADGLSGNEAEQTNETTTAAEPARRGRKSNKDKNQPDPATATAPPPVAIPGAPVDMTPGPNGIPAGLDRSNPAAVVNAAPPPPPPPAPPAPPAAPPSGILAGKVIAELDRRGTDDANKKLLVDWMASPSVGLVNAGSSYDETIAAVRLMPDDKLGAVATALAVA